MKTKHLPCNIILLEKWILTSVNLPKSKKHLKIRHHILRSEHIITLSILLNLQQSAKIHWNVSCSEPFEVCYLFVTNKKGASERRTEAWRAINSSKTHIVSLEISNEFLISVILPKSKKRLKIRHYVLRSECCLSEIISFWSDKNEIRSVSWRSLPSTWPKSTQAEVVSA